VSVRIVASLDRKRVGGGSAGSEKCTAEAFSIRRLEGSRWRLRRTLAMGIECRFRTWKAEEELPSSVDGLVGFVPKLAIRPE
jgi:hypothetical protein